MIQFSFVVKFDCGGFQRHSFVVCSDFSADIALKQLTYTQFMHTQHLNTLHPYRILIAGYKTNSEKKIIINFQSIGCEHICQLASVINFIDKWAIRQASVA